MPGTDLNLVWLPEAREDVDRLYRFLVEKSPADAAKAIRLIIGGSERLREFPEIGRPMNDDTDRRDLFLPFGASAYVLRYRISGDRLVIIRVWHGLEARKR